jgi:hypothetical protein
MTDDLKARLEALEAKLEITLGLLASLLVKR